MARGKSNAKKNIKFARGKVDKAQTKLIQMNSKKINELLGETEDKYNITASNGLQEIAFPSMQTAANRRLQIYPINIGSLVGTNDTSRIGDRISLKTIQLRYQLQLINGAVTSADQYNRVRVLMFWDNQPATLLAGLPATNPPEWPQIFQSINVGLNQDPNLVSLSTYQNDQWPARFSKVYDKVHTLSSNGNVSTAIGMGARAVTGDVRFFKSYAGRKISFNAGGKVAMNRALYLAFISDSTIISHPYVDFFVKSTYTDS